METPLETSLAPPPAGSPPPGPQLRPFTLGEILDRAVAIFRGDFKLLFGLSLVFHSLTFVLTQAFEYVSQTRFAALTRPGAVFGQPPPLDQVVGFVVLLFAYVAAYGVITQILGGAVTLAGGKRLVGEEPQFTPALKGSLGAAFTLLVALLLAMTIITGGSLLAALPGGALVGAGFFVDSPFLRVACVISGLVIAGLCSLGIGLWLFVRYGLIAQTVMLEGRGPWSALKRSAELMKGRVEAGFFGICIIRASVVYAVSLCVALTVGVVLFVPQGIVNAIYGISPFDPQHYDPAAVPALVTVCVHLFQTLVQSAVTPFGMLALVVFYYDLRIRREGLDLELQASRLGGQK